MNTPAPAKSHHRLQASRVWFAGLRTTSPHLVLLDLLLEYLRPFLDSLNLESMLRRVLAPSHNEGRGHQLAMKKIANQQFWPPFGLHAYLRP